MHYDITIKFITGKGKTSIFQHFKKGKKATLELIKSLPQELPDVKKGDFLLKVTYLDGTEEIHVWEFKSRWNPHDVENLMIYTLRARQTYRLPVKPVMFLLLESKSATGNYNDEQFQFHFELIKMWEEDGKAVLTSDDFYLYPFLPLMDTEEEIVLEAEKKLYNSTLNLEEKSDLLSAMAILAGLKDKKLSQKMFERRRDIMLESYAYDVFREDAIKTVSKEYEEKGMQKGEKKGLQIAIQRALELKFGDEGKTFSSQIQSIDSIEKLNDLLTIILTTDNIDHIQSAL